MELPICSSSLPVITKFDRSLQKSILFGGYGTTVLTFLLSPYLYGPMFPEVGSSCGSDVHVKEFDVPLRLSCPARLWTRKGSSNFDLCGILGYQYLFSHASSLHLGRGRAEPESAQFRRVRSMDQTMCPWMRVVYFAALQQIIFNADRSASERMIRDRSRTTRVS